MDLNPGPSQDQKLSEEIDVDALPPTQYLILEVLAARHRTGEMLWTFPSRPAIIAAADQLARLGLISWKGGVEPKTIRAWLTDAGGRTALMEGYETPLEKARRAAYQAGREDAAKANTALLDALRRLRDHWYRQPGWTDAADTVDVLIDAFSEQRAAALARGQHTQDGGER